MQTFQVFEDENGQEGLPFWITRNVDPEIRIVVETYPNYGKQALDEWEEKNKDKKKKQHEVPYLVVVNGAGEPVEYGGLTRQRFSEAAIQEAQDRDDEIDVERERPAGGYNPADYGDGLTEPA